MWKNDINASDNAKNLKLRLFSMVVQKQFDVPARAHLVRGFSVWKADILLRKSEATLLQNMEQLDKMHVANMRQKDDEYTRREATLLKTRLCHLLRVYSMKSDCAEVTRAFGLWGRQTVLQRAQEVHVAQRGFVLDKHRMSTRLLHLMQLHEQKWRVIAVLRAFCQWQGVAMTMRQVQHGIDESSQKVKEVLIRQHVKERLSTFLRMHSSVKHKTAVLRAFGLWRHYLASQQLDKREAFIATIRDESTSRAMLRVRERFGDLLRARLSRDNFKNAAHAFHVWRGTVVKSRAQHQLVSKITPSTHGSFLYFYGIYAVLYFASEGNNTLSQ